MSDLPEAAEESSAAGADDQPPGAADRGGSPADEGAKGLGSEQAGLPLICAVTVEVARRWPGSG
jgi:hypothetical protein